MGYEDTTSKLTILYKVPQYEEQKDNVPDGTFRIYLNPNTLDDGVKINKLESNEQYEKLLQEIIKDPKICLYYGLDSKNESNEIKIFAPTHDRVFFISVSQGGKSLQCFSTISPIPPQDKEIMTKAIKLEKCTFKVLQTTSLKAQKGFDDANKLREYVKTYFSESSKPKIVGYEKYTYSVYINKENEVNWDTSNNMPKKSKNVPDIEAIKAEVGKQIEQYKLLKIELESRNYRLGDKKAEYFCETIENNYKKAKSLNDFKEVHNQIKQRLSSIKRAFSDYVRRNTYYSNEYEKNFIRKIPTLEEDLDSMLIKESFFTDEIKKQYGFACKPDIVRYSPSVLSDNALSCEPDKITRSTFFKALFLALNQDIKSIQEAYKKYEEKSNRTFLTQMEKKLESAIKELSRRFNQFYYHKEANIYDFEITLDKTEIAFSMKKDENPINLSQQSAGFQWFFHFFFNFAYKISFDSSDIVLLDEAETHLSIPAQIELRDFLRNFGKQNGITFVITTHSPYFIDMDNLNEVRLVKARTNGVGAEIINDFHSLTVLLQMH